MFKVGRNRDSLIHKNKKKKTVLTGVFRILFIILVDLSSTTVTVPALEIIPNSESRHDS